MGKEKLSLLAVWRLFSKIRPTQLIAILLRDFWFRAIAKRRKGLCTVISRSFPRSADIVAWPMQRRFAYRAKFQKLFNDRGELRTLAIKNYERSAEKISHGRVLVPSPMLRFAISSASLSSFFTETLHDNTLYGPSN